MVTTRQDEQKKLMELSSQLTQTSSRLNDYERFTPLSAEVMKEMKVLFPSVRTLSMAKVTEAQRDTTLQKNFVAAIISTDGKTRMAQEEFSRLQKWLKERSKADSLVIYR